MSDFILDKLTTVKAVCLDVDGVLTDGSVYCINGEECRRMHVRDGFAIQYAIKNGLPIWVISGAENASVAKRLNRLGVTELFMGVKNKLEKLNDICTRNQISLSDVLFFGDDIPDYEVMLAAGVSVCPNDAADDIIRIAKIITRKNGGDACVRELLEKVLRAQDKWMIDTKVRSQ